MSDSSDSEECEGLLKKALEVTLPYDFNPNSVPQDGTEYLHHVIYERRNIQKYVRANIDTNKYKSNQTFNLPTSTSEVETKIDKRCLPSSEWQSQKLRSFNDFKQVLDVLVNKHDVSESAFIEDQFIDTFKTTGPKLSTFVSFPQSAKIRILEIITKHFQTTANNWEVEDTIGEWIFAVLTTLSIPLSPHGCYVIREFARTCRTVRSKLPEYTDKKVCEPLNFYICICSKIYRQIDLAD